MKLPKSAHTSQPWRINELAPDFTVEDVWALPTPGGPDEFPRLVSQVFATNFPQAAPLVVRILWAARLKIGALFGWDDPDDGLGFRVATLRDRLPADLRAAPSARGLDIHPFKVVYQLDNEWAAELANRTVHGVMHLGWVPDGSGRYRGQMAVLVKPNGLFGTVYMAAIKPLRYLFVYPALLREVERSWQAGIGGHGTGGEAATSGMGSPSLWTC
jgi:Protein of unknown function (DUF2867)